MCEAYNFSTTSEYENMSLVANSSEYTLSLILKRMKEKTNWQPTQVALPLYCFYAGNKEKENCISTKYNFMSYIEAEKSAFE